MAYYVSFVVGAEVGWVLVLRGANGEFAVSV